MMNATTMEANNSRKEYKGYIVTGRAAHGRVARLFQSLLLEYDHPPHDDDAAADGVGVVSESVAAGNHHDDNKRNNNNSNSNSNSNWIDLSPYAAAAVEESKKGLLLESATAAANTITAESSTGIASSSTSLLNTNTNNNNNNNNYYNNNYNKKSNPSASNPPASNPALLTTSTSPSISFLWENAPRSETRHFRDGVSVYSHLPNGISVLDDKWALARLLSPHSSSISSNGNNGNVNNGNVTSNGGAITDDSSSLATLESHCFRGQEFKKFAQRVGLLTSSKSKKGPKQNKASTRYQFEDLVFHNKQQQQQQQQQQQLSNNDYATPTIATTATPPPPSPPNLWVVKDAMSNGAGGIWILDPTNVHQFIDESGASNDDHDDHDDEIVVSVDGANEDDCNNEGGVNHDNDVHNEAHLSCCDSISNIRATSASTKSSSTTTKTTTTTTKSTTTKSSTTKTSSSILHPQHRYIAQRYAWPPTLYQQRKCHVRVYGLITSDGKAYIHRKAFLHVANDLFDYGGCERSEHDEGERSEHLNGDSSHDDGNQDDTQDDGSQDDATISIFQPSVHITNCCANSHDSDKFSGEICVDLQMPGPFSNNTAGEQSEHFNGDGEDNSQDKLLLLQQQQQQQQHNANIITNDNNNNNNNNDIPLGDYFPSIAASMATLAQRSAPFLRGGEANSGFEYLGLDFVLSSVVDDSNDDDDDNNNVGSIDEGNSNVAAAANDNDNGPSSSSSVIFQRKPVAYLLEVNSPPSQDTATGLPHAEQLHDDVISDLLRMWVLPKLGIGNGSECGGWKCVYSPTTIVEGGALSNSSSSTTTTISTLIAPSKAAILNRIRWAMFERKSAREYEALFMNREDDSLVSVGAERLAEKPSTKTFLDDNVGLWTEENPSICKKSMTAKTDGDFESACNHFDSDSFVSFVRNQFPYFSHDKSSNIFFESGGGAQVPQMVTNAISSSMSNRDRSVIGATCQTEARRALASLLIGDTEKEVDTIIDPNENADNIVHKLQDDNDDHVIILGSNATSLLDTLAKRYIDSGALRHDDEIIIATENHLANVLPWIAASKAVGAKVKWWTVTNTTKDHRRSKKSLNENAEIMESHVLSDLVNAKTKIVAVSHASNIMGCVRDIASICSVVHTATNSRGHVVVDGVAAAPHLLSHSLYQNGMAAKTRPDWHVVSLHKLYGPHMGCLVGKQSIATQLHTTVQQPMSLSSNDKREELWSVSKEVLCKSWELGTINYEACAGACALKGYFESIATRSHNHHSSSQEMTREGSNHSLFRTSQASNQLTTESLDDHQGEQKALGGIDMQSCVCLAQYRIQQVEDRLLNHMMDYLRKYAPTIRIIDDVSEMKVTPDTIADKKCSRLPIISFVHISIPSSDIVKHCRMHGIICRSCKFLSTEKFWDEMRIMDNGVVRFSLAHYNTMDEIDRAVGVLKMLTGWPNNYYE